ncbi:MAG TPA: penicillin-binding transpeptidase domain-containing protein [Bryobacteraceae bacterium]|nr:penicillin-binding transpeptidase domain-containing protein [Bryobacteraceae bacterium]
MITRRAILNSLAVSPLLRSASLPDQSAAIVLDRAFPDPGVSYLLLDAPSGRVIASRWEHPEEPAPVGSLVKPFTALAYGETHDFRFPVFTCQGDVSHCWLPQGHGRMEITTAIAHSCNAYFLELARDVKPEALESVTCRFSVNPPEPWSLPPALIGLHGSWKILPLAIARAYSELAKRSIEPGINEVLTGMALSARFGTGRAAGKGAYVKTGTAPCIHAEHQAGDGYVIALYPTDAPRYTLLVRVHGVPGAVAAVTCGRMRARL